ncbi:hypothetical protein SAMN05444422_108208 [Halobiforma haloterrestris]|uniref:Uncharacterized protein n=1 Tax=Natronobacterium haloterrestre TaxID=148448 RepID=A0A1I1J9F5_NATHA|nr:hypothetical protein [Halobiforma haloterrestris]SFC45239.1 hypothetical protein SAMN05444422_108208 [Halobiforma haloterrestris]
MSPSGDPPAVESSYTELPTTSSADADGETDGEADGDTDSNSVDGPTGVRPSERPAVEVAHDTCAACGTTIGPTDYRLSWQFSDGPASVERHYCSESCFPDLDLEHEHEHEREHENQRTDRTDEGNRPQDWSYCR